MTPPEAKILVVDDDIDNRESLVEFLEMAGHIIVGQAGSVDLALSLIQTLNPDEVDVALFDGNLSIGSVGGVEGALLSQEFRKRFPGKPLLSISVDSQPWSDDPSLTRMAGSYAITQRVTELSRG